MDGSRVSDDGPSMSRGWNGERVDWMERIFVRSIILSLEMRQKSVFHALIEVCQISWTNPFVAAPYNCNLIDLLSMELRHGDWLWLPEGGVRAIVCEMYPAVC